MQLEQVRSPPACQLLSLSLSLHTEAVNDVIQNSKTLKNQQTFHCFLHDNEKVTVNCHSRKSLNFQCSSEPPFTFNDASN